MAETPDKKSSLHPDVAALACLLGTWSGTGQGHYPTVEPFEYHETVVFGHVGKPSLSYRQATVNLGNDMPSHAETGYLRGFGDARIELVLAHPTGVAEVAEGEIEVTDDGLHLVLRSTDVASTATAKPVQTLERRIEVAGDLLRYDLYMGAVGQEHQHHLAAELRREGGGTT
jgi:hypothetical protein